MNIQFIFKFSLIVCCYLNGTSYTYITKQYVNEKININCMIILEMGFPDIFRRNNSFWF